MYMLDAGSGDVMSPFGNDVGGGGDLMAYNAFPDGLSSTPLSSLGGLGGGGGGGYGGYDGGDAYGQQQQQQQQPQHPVSHAQASNAQAQAQAQAQANQAAQMAQAYTLAPKSASLVIGSATSQAAAAPSRVAAKEADPGYLETLWQKRRDVAKLCILALVILLAISAHSAAWHYLREYIETASRLTQWQELGLRVAYPAIVLIFLWNLKALQ